MGLKDLTADEIIKVIKKKEAPYHSRGYLYFDNTKLSPNKIFDAFSITESLHTINKYNDINRNIYTKLLSILLELNNEQIYLKIPNSYTMDEKYKKKYESQLKYLPEMKEKKDNPKETPVKQQPLNQILYGPPGTGKTYNTINKALKIILEQEQDNEIKKILEKNKHTNEERKTLTDKFKEFEKLGQIEFVTFHQSYGYEEFVEGIKADLKNKNIKYILENGIFKELSQKAFNKQNFNEKIEELKNKIKTNGSFNISSIRGNIFEINYKNGDNFLVRPENTKKPEGDNYSIPIQHLDDYYHGRKTKKEFTNSTYVVGIVEYMYNEIKDEKIKNYILIIDEINRGNISKIFGELITLIEPSKRLGADEELKLTLPNSKKSFGVPSNLYIIGTMNTADRSIVQIDTALRRRFEFVEMMPNSDLLKDVIITHDDTKIEIKKILEAINERIEYIYDREHTIGHSYFLPLIEAPTKEKLDDIFEVKILPLLTEYFYGDWADIIEVLNDNGFITEKRLTYTTKTDRSNKVYEIKKKPFKASEYIKIYETDNS